ncbi:MAG TPA: Tim44-like domain-containing protein [Burkholderiaceae bacterium]|nr:Tim44-like domain-containing protein [Burkholderiaceae bacterium]
MKTWIAGLVVGVMAASFAFDAEAQRRLGGGKTFGKQSTPVQQRQATPPQQQPQATPAQQANQPAAAPTAAGAATAGAAKAASPMRGALMGLAAGLGLMALASWLGFGEAFATFLLFALAGVLILTLIGFLMRRRAAPAPAYAGRGPGPATYGPVGYETSPAPQPLQRTAVEPAAAAARPGSAMDAFTRGSADAPIAPWGIPAGFDTPAFVAQAKSYFTRLQGAWDNGSLDQLSEFTTNDMFIALTHELRSRGAGEHHTEVVTLEAELLGIESGATEHMASVKFDGTLKIDGEIERVHEVWNLVKPVDGKTGWLLAGIQQLS